MYQNTAKCYARGITHALILYSYRLNENSNIFVFLLDQLSKIKIWNSCEVEILTWFHIHEVIFIAMLFGN